MRPCGGSGSADELSERHPRLNLLNLEAAASARVLDAAVLMSPQAAKGVLPTVLEAERIGWETVDLS